MYCNYCGKQIDNKSKFCNFCGQKISITIRNENINGLSNKIYEEFLIKNEVLRRMIVDNNLFNLDNSLLYVFNSFGFHMFFFRVLLSSKYSEEDIKKILVICLDKFTTSIFNDAYDKNKFVDTINQEFDMLDTLLSLIKDSTDKEEANFYMQEMAKSFIESVIDEDNINHSAVAVCKIATYFTLLLTDNDLLLRIEK